MWVEYVFFISKSQTGQPTAAKNRISRSHFHSFSWAIELKAVSELELINHSIWAVQNSISVIVVSLTEATHTLAQRERQKKVFSANSAAAVDDDARWKAGRIMFEKCQSVEALAAN